MNESAFPSKQRRLDLEMVALVVKVVYFALLCSVLPLIMAAESALDPLVVVCSLFATVLTLAAILDLCEAIGGA